MCIGRSMNFERIEVECYSGHRVNERPTAFTFRGRHLKIAQIVDRWYEGSVEASRPVADYFRVRTCGGEVFLLRYLSLFDAWSVLVREGSKGDGVSFRNEPA